MHGLGTDYTTLHKPGKDDPDQFQQHLANIITASVGAAAATNVRPTIQHVDGGDVCRIQVDPLLDRAEVPAQISATDTALGEREPMAPLRSRRQSTSLGPVGRLDQDHPQVPVRVGDLGCEGIPLLL